MVMDVQNGRLTGSHITINDGYTPLFFSKVVAEKVAKSTGGEVRGVSQKHLFKLLNLLEITNAKTLVFPLDTNSGFVMPIDDIRKFYLT